ncbi:hypothetical protein DUU57_14120 [Salmonella enterica subsp. enterica serovar Weltevreden]|nr:hypothetical protein [Salmonella enterica subsp. enterica serovar Weltevreden]
MLGNKKGLLEQIYSFSVFPAPAGINRSFRASPSVCGSVPRASGDKPAAKAVSDFFSECSPRQRG